MLSGNSSYILKSIGNNYFRRYITMWTILFIYLLDGIKKIRNERKLSVKAILPISIAYIDILKTCRLFYLVLFHYIKIFFFLSDGKMAYPFTEENLILLITWSFLPHKRFLISPWVILSSNCDVIFMFNNQDYGSSFSFGRPSFHPTVFEIYLHL